MPEYLKVGSIMVVEHGAPLTPTPPAPWPMQFARCWPMPQGARGGANEARPPDHRRTREIVSIEKGKITKKGGAFHARQ
jgi:hypothetical protein